MPYLSKERTSYGMIRWSKRCHLVSIAGIFEKEHFDFIGNLANATQLKLRK